MRRDRRVLADLYDGPKREQSRDDKSAHDTFMGMLCGPITTDHLLIILHEVHDCHYGENQHRDCDIRV
jgi:hypothetical protein